MNEPIIPVVLRRWVEQADPPRRWWRKVAWSVYAHADRDPQVADYLLDADRRELVEQLARALRQVATTGIPAVVLILLHREYLETHHHVRPLTAPVFDGLAAAIGAALAQHGVPGDAVAEVTADVTSLRAAVLLGAPTMHPTPPPYMALHPWLLPRPGTGQLRASAAELTRRRGEVAAS